MLNVILEQCLPRQKCEVLLFGSRTTGHCQEMSDIDIAVKSAANIRTPLRKIREMLEESVIPFEADVLDYYDMPGKWRKSIDETGVLIWKN